MHAIAELGADAYVVRPIAIRNLVLDLTGHWKRVTKWAWLLDHTLAQWWEVGLVVALIQ